MDVCLSNSLVRWMLICTGTVSMAVACGDSGGEQPADTHQSGDLADTPVEPTDIHQSSDLADTPVEPTDTGNQPDETEPDDATKPPIIGSADPDFPYQIPESVILETVTVAIDSQDKSALHHAVYGFNTNVSGSAFGWDDADYQAKIALLAPGSLRFPGGHAANYYRWKMNGEIFDSYQGWPQDGKRVDLALKAFTAANRTVGLADYAQLVNDLGIEPVILMNILTQEPADAVEMLTDMKEMFQLSPKRIELGNEIFLPGQNNEDTATVQLYISYAETFATAIHAVHPEVEIGLCIAPITKPLEEWNGPVGKATYYDAVMPHEYGYISGPESEEKPTDIQKITALLSGEQKVDGYVAGLKKQFPGKKVWATEWNMLPNQKDALNGTPAHAIFLASSLLQRLGHPDVYEAANKHNLVAAYGTVANQQFDSNKSTSETPFWLLFGQTLAGATGQLAVTLTNSQVADWSFVHAHARAFEAPGQIRVLFLNKLSFSKTLTLEVDGAPWTGGGTAASRGYTQLKTTPVISPTQSGITTATFAGAQVTVPPYSLTELVLNTGK